MPCLSLLQWHRHSVMTWKTWVYLETQFAELELPLVRQWQLQNSRPSCQTVSASPLRWQIASRYRQQQGSCRSFCHRRHWWWCATTAHCPQDRSRHRRWAVPCMSPHTGRLEDKAFGPWLSVWHHSLKHWTADEGLHTDWKGSGEGAYVDCLPLSCVWGDADMCVIIRSGSNQSTRGRSFQTLSEHMFHHQQGWLQTCYRSSDELFIGMLNGFRQVMIVFFADASPSEDYRELLQLCHVFQEGSSDEELFFCMPGEMHHTHWLSKALYSVKIFLFKYQMMLTTHETADLTKICLFLPHLCPLLARGSTNRESPFQWPTNRNRIDDFYVLAKQYFSYLSPFGRYYNYH